MASAEPRTPPAGVASIAWWLVAAVALVAGTRGLSGPAVHVYAAGPTARTWSLWALILAWAAAIAIASLATWRLVRLSSRRDGVRAVRAAPAAPARAVGRDRAASRLVAGLDRRRAALPLSRA